MAQWVSPPSLSLEEYPGVQVRAPRLWCCERGVQGLNFVVRLVQPAELSFCLRTCFVPALTFVLLRELMLGCV